MQAQQYAPTVGVAQQPAPMVPLQYPAPYAPAQTNTFDISTLLSSIMPLLMMVMVMGMVMPMFKDMAGALKR